jgi:hypothetical protein
MKVGKGYNSAVECHLDMVEVISLILIIPKPNVSPSIKQFFVFYLIALFTPEARVIYTSSFLWYLMIFILPAQSSVLGAEAICLALHPSQGIISNTYVGQARTHWVQPIHVS